MKAEDMEARAISDRMEGFSCPSCAVSASIGQKYSCGWGTWLRAKPA